VQWKRFTAGAQFAEVEVDIETGKVERSSRSTTAALSSTP
jgi:hypothetical protein